MTILSMFRGDRRGKMMKLQTQAEMAELWKILRSAQRRGSFYKLIAGTRATTPSRQKQLQE